MYTNITIFYKDDLSTKKELCIEHDESFLINEIWNVIKAELRQLAFIKYNSLIGTSIDFRIILMGLLLGNDKVRCTKGFINEIPDYDIYLMFTDRTLSDKKIHIIIKDNKRTQSSVLKELDFSLEFPVMNCVDRFINTKAKEAIENINDLIDKLKDDSIARNEQIQVFKQYHNTVQYETDFRNLTELKNTSKELYEYTKEFLENLTYVKYTE